MSSRVTESDWNSLCGTAAEDFTLLDWFPGCMAMGNGRAPVSLRGVIKWKHIMRLGNIEKQLIALTPSYNETIDQMLMRVPLPHEAPNRDTHPERKARHKADNKLWTEHCQQIINDMTHKLTQLSRWEVLNVRIMANRVGPRPSPIIARQSYRRIVALIGGHEAALLAFLRAPVHMRTVETPDHLLMSQVRTAIDTGDFSHLQAPPGSGLSTLCVAASAHHGATYDNRIVPSSDVDDMLTHLQTDVTALPRLASYEADEALWTGDNKRGEQIMDMVDKMKHLPFADRDILLSPTARFQQVQRAARDNRLMWETVPEHTRWYLVVVWHGRWALNSKYNVSRPLDLNIDYHAPSDNTQHPSIVTDADAICLNLPRGCDSLRKAILRVGVRASGADSAQEVIREVKRRLGNKTLLGAGRPTPTPDWERQMDRILELLDEARSSQTLEQTLYHRPNQAAWARGDFTPSVAHGGPPDADH